MEIIKVKIKDLNPAKYNPRKINDKQLDGLRNSIRTFGLIDPIIVNKKGNTIVGGHMRTRAAEIEGHKEVPVVYVDLSPAEEKALNVALNSHTISGEYDMDILPSLLEEIQDELPDTFTDLNFGDFELPEVEVEVLPGQTDEDEVPEVVDPITKRGDIWLLGKHRVMCGDSTMIDDVEKLMNGEKADMVFTDPPYGVDYKGINNDSRGGLFELLDGAFANYLATSKSGASIYCFHSDRCADIFHEIFRKYFHFSSMIIWNKNSLTLSQTDYQSKHEPCMYGWMNNGAHSFHGDRKQLSVWDVHKEHVPGHTTPKPIGVIDKAIMNSSKGDDMVADLFLGSGSTLICAEKNQRKCFGMELDEKYCDVIVNRWQNYTGKEATLESTGETYNSLKGDK